MHSKIFSALQLLLLVAVAENNRLHAELVAHWPLNEGQGDVFTDLAGGNDGFIPRGNVPEWSSEVPPTTFENPFSLEFTRANQGFVDTLFEGIGGDQARTISAWVRTENTATQGIVGYGDTGAGQKWHFNINGDGDPRVPGAPRTESSGGNLTGDMSVADGEWHNVVSVFTSEFSDNADVLHYVDGILQGETGLTPNLIDTSIGGGLPTVSIGARQNAPPLYDAFFDGFIDDVRMYDRALSEAEVMSLGSSPPTDGLVAHWPMDDGQGVQVTETISGNHGALRSAVDVSVEWANDGPDGIQSQSVRFTGDEGPSYIETPFEGIGGADARTITLWVKADPQPNNTAMVAWGALENGRKWHFRIDQATNALRTEYQGGQNFAETDIADGEWHFVASVFPQDAEFGSEILHFLDGEFDEFGGGNDREIDTAIGLDENAFPVHIGSAVGHANRFFVGQIADVRIYDEELDESALIEIMMGGGNRAPGDFDGDGELTAADIDTLSAAIRDGLTDRIFDLNEDGSVNGLDRIVWVEDIKKTFFGDSNLDGEFNSNDFVTVFIPGEYEDNVPNNSSWATGDWNGDSEFSSSDFVVAFTGAGYEQGPRLTAVPEPSAAAWTMLCVVLVIRFRRPLRS